MTLGRSATTTSSVATEPPPRPARAAARSRTRHRRATSPAAVGTLKIARGVLLPRRLPGLESGVPDMNASMSAASSSSCVLVEPIPCPASSTTRNSTGARLPEPGGARQFRRLPGIDPRVVQSGRDQDRRILHAVAHAQVAVHGQQVTEALRGFVGPELRNVRRPVGRDLGAQVLAAGTWSITPANSSGRSSIARPTVIPRADPPRIKSECRWPAPRAMRVSAQAMRSRQVLGLLESLPARRQASPSSPPPRTWRSAVDAPVAMNRIHSGLKLGSVEMPYDPSTLEQHRSAAPRRLRRITVSGTRTPSRGAVRLLHANRLAW